MKMLQKVLIFLYKQIETVLFPSCCLLCGKFHSSIWCEECKKELYKKAIFKIEEKDSSCFIKQHIYVFQYEGKIRNLILDYKFKDKSYLYKIFSEIIIKNKKICGILKKYDIIMPVPIHEKRKKQRGYNQSELIAKQIAKIDLKLQYENKILQKVKNTIPQSSLSKEQRKQNVQNVYKLVKEKGAEEISIITIAKD